MASVILGRAAPDPAGFVSYVLAIGLGIGTAACGGAPVEAAHAPPAAPVAVRAAAWASPGVKSAADAEEALIERVGKLVRTPSPSGPLRSQVEPIAFRIADLPLSSLPPPLPPGALLMPEAPPSDATDDLVIEVDKSAPWSTADYTARVSAREGRLGSLKIGPWTGGPGGVAVRCGTASRLSIFPARWESLRGVPVPAAPEPGQSIADGPKVPGSLALEVFDGWFAPETCKLTVAKRTSIKAQAMDGQGFVYAYRECSGGCAESAALIVLFPATRNVALSGVQGSVLEQDVTGGFTRVRIPLRRGGGTSLMAQVGPFEVEGWRYGLMGKKSPSNSGRYFGPPVILGLEVAQGVDDAEPVAVVYIDRAAGLVAVDEGPIDFDDPLSLRR